MKQDRRIYVLYCTKNNFLKSFDEQVTFIKFTTDLYNYNINIFNNMSNINTYNPENKIFNSKFNYIKDLLKKSSYEDIYSQIDELKEDITFVSFLGFSIEDSLSFIPKLPNRIQTILIIQIIDEELDDKLNIKIRDCNFNDQDIIAISEELNESYMDFLNKNEFDLDEDIDEDIDEDYEDENTDNSLFKQEFINMFKSINDSEIEKIDKKNIKEIHSFIEDEISPTITIKLLRCGKIIINNGETDIVISNYIKEKLYEFLKSNIEEEEQ